MDKNEINSKITTYVDEHLSPKSQEVALVSELYKELHSILGETTIQSGSQGRDTSNSPIHDLDIIWELPESLAVQLGEFRTITKSQIKAEELKVKDILKDLANRIEIEYKKLGRNVIVKEQSHSVGIVFIDEDEFSIDVVPGIPNGVNDFQQPVYLVPEIINSSHKRRLRSYERHKEINWIYSDPRGYIKDVQNLDAINYNFRKSVRFLKTWKSNAKLEHKGNFLKSFHIEQIIYRYFTANCLEVSSVDAITYFFSNIRVFVAKAQIPDRADKDKFIDSYVEDKLSDSDKSFIVGRASYSLRNFSDPSLRNDENIEDLIEFTLLNENKIPKAITVVDQYSKDEQFLEQHFDIKIEKSGYKFTIDAEVSKNKGTRDMKLSSIPYLKKGCSLKFFVDKCDLQEEHKLMWKVRNYGNDAARKQQLRGEITNDTGNRIKEESSSYKGRHYVECYAINSNNVCIATARLEVPII